MNVFAPNPTRRIGGLLLWICVSSLIATGCAPKKPPAQVEEMRQRSVTEDPAVRGEVPNDWLVPDAGAGLPHTPPAASEILEFYELFEKTRTPGLVEAELAPGATRTVSLQVSGPSGVAASVKWIGTTSPLTVTLALNGATLATGTAYHYGRDKGGSYVRTTTTAGGLATVSATNTSSATVKVNIVFMATAL
jgi:cytoskeletal protein RodZ